MTLLKTSPHLLILKVVLCSCIFLLAQADGWVIPKTTSIFLAPSLLASMAALFAVAVSRIVPTLPMIIEQSTKLHVAGMVEVLC